MSHFAEAGCCSDRNIKACEAAGINPVVPVARDEHHSDWRERRSEPAPPPENAAPCRLWVIV